MPDFTASHAIAHSVVPTWLRVGVCCVSCQSFTSFTTLPVALQNPQLDPYSDPVLRRTIRTLFTRTVWNITAYKKKIRLSKRTTVKLTLATFGSLQTAQHRQPPYGKHLTLGEFKWHLNSCTVQGAEADSWVRKQVHNVWKRRVIEVQ